MSLPIQRTVAALLVLVTALWHLLQVSHHPLNGVSAVLMRSLRDSMIWIIACLTSQQLQLGHKHVVMGSERMTKSATVELYQ